MLRCGWTRCVSHHNTMTRKMEMTLELQDQDSLRPDDRWNGKLDYCRERFKTDEGETLTHSELVEMVTYHQLTVEQEVRKRQYYVDIMKVIGLDTEVNSDFEY